jgi:hypothetical protein
VRKLLPLLVVLGAVGLLLTHPANAGLFSKSVSDADAKDLKRIGIASPLGNKLQGQQVGLTVFGNAHFDTDLPDWTLDAEVRKQLLEEISASGRLTATLEPWLNAPADNWKSIVSVGRAQGFDAVLVVEPVQNENDRLLPPGPSLRHNKLMGLDRVHICNSTKVEMYRISDGKRIAFAMPNPCDYTKSLPPEQGWHANWAGYSDEEKRAVLEAILAFVHKQMYEVLTTLNLQRR